jgi:predicted O-methyltransferase YrrM/uncharacterized glyoxalase superfamily protein PhnB
MDDKLRVVLDDLHRYGVEYDAGKVDRLERLRNVEPDSARVLAALVRAAGARRVLEIGTSNGYSTLWLADAIRDVGGRLVSVDTDPARSALAAQNLDRADLREWVELRVGDAGASLRDAREQSWDMIFLDAERPAYVDYWQDLVRALRPGGVLVVDNALSHADEIEDFRSLVVSDERVSEATVPTGAGLLLVVRDPASGLKPNRSIPRSTVIPVLIYPDVRDAVDWLGMAFGFVLRVWIGDNHRAQLNVGDGAVIVGDERRAPRPGEVTHAVMVRVADARAHCERAREQGARIVMEPTDFEYGERQYTAEDPAGHHWTFSETLTDVAPEEWGGALVARD